MVVEEKVDGANCAVSFSSEGELLLQSRGHYLTGGGREKHFNLFKQWANIHATSFYEVLADRYIMYGEWLYAKHTVFYTALPHYFMEFDIFDTATGEFLSTERRHDMLRELPVMSVAVLGSGCYKQYDELIELIQQSGFIDDGHIGTLGDYCRETDLDVDRAFRETDMSHLMEGLYIKHEEEGCVVGRYKYVRASFLTAVVNAEGSDMRNSSDHCHRERRTASRLEQNHSIWPLYPAVRGPFLCTRL
ncbi:hypothetical protein BVY04_01375 [bacterium M21]|nr:hypothetical protein BVY04_01375 [bacterium M21]